VNLMPGSYVTHAKLPELGSGEILSAQDGFVAIRFSTGNRTFKVELVVRHLTVTSEAPLPPPKAAKRPRKSRASKLQPSSEPPAVH
jgi:hypothetical protein